MSMNSSPVQVKRENVVIPTYPEPPADKNPMFLETRNDFLRLMILPQIGGRIHIGQDKTNGHDFFYRQNVIKPALVGLGRKSAAKALLKKVLSLDINHPLAADLQNEWE